jgi:predicted aldo/keto reductase-like oxidoreductase
VILCYMMYAGHSEMKGMELVDTRASSPHNWVKHCLDFRFVQSTWRFMNSHLVAISRDIEQAKGKGQEWTVVVGEPTSCH